MMTGKPAKTPWTWKAYRERLARPCQPRPVPLPRLARRASAVMTNSDWARFWSYVSVQPSGCWEWMGGRCNGYGRFNVGPYHGQIKFGSHRLALVAVRGESDGIAMHECDNPPCCNPWHLRWGTHAENRDDCARRGRTARVMTPEVAMAIKECLARGLGPTVIGRVHKVSAGAVSRIQSGRTWRHVGPPMRGKG